MRSPIASQVLGGIAIACRVAAWALVALVAADAFLPAGPRAALLAANGVAARLVPGPLLGLLVFQTPFGGAFRGDFALAAVLLLVVDWLLVRASASLRRRRERGV